MTKNGKLAVDVRRGPGARNGAARRAKLGGRLWSAKAEAAFFKRLAATGNVTASVRAVGFSAGTVYARRHSCPAFAEKWRTALATARVRPPGPTAVRYATGGRAKRIRCVVQWSEEVEERFLDLLAASCNVSLSAAQTGVGTTSVYRRRRLRADFAAKWQAALEQGYARLEMGLVEAAIKALKGGKFDAERPAPRMSAETALKVLQLHRAAVLGVGRKSGWRAPVKPIEHYRESILRKIAAIKAARGGTADGASPEAR